MITNVTNVPESLKIPSLTEDEKVNKYKQTENMLLEFGF